MKLNKGETKLLGLLLEYCGDLMGRKICNDLSDDMKACLSQTEWDSLNKYYHEQNGDPEEFEPGRSMMDFCALYALTKKLGI